jgi:hypothetical protein
MLVKFNQVCDCVFAGISSTLMPDILKMQSPKQNRQEAEYRIHVAAVPKFVNFCFYFLHHFATHVGDGIEMDDILNIEFY